MTPVSGMAPTCLDNPEEKENSLVHQPFLMDEEVQVTATQACRNPDLEFQQDEIFPDNFSHIFRQL